MKGKLLLLMLFLSIVGTQRGMAYSFAFEGVYYNIMSEDDKTCEVTYMRKGTPNGTTVYQSDYSGVITIPRTANGYKVIGIGEHAFEQWTWTNVNGTYQWVIEDADITAVTVSGRNLSYIGSRAFYGCKALATIELPTTVTSIGNEAFMYCSALKTYDFSNIETIGVGAFAYSGLTEIDIPDGCTSVGASAFKGLTIKKLHIGEGLTTINYLTLYATLSMDTLVIPANIQSISSQYSVRSVKSLKVEDSDVALSVTKPWFKSANIYMGRNITCSADPFEDATNVTIGNHVTSLNNILTYSKNPAITTLTTDMTSVPDNFLGRTTITTLTFGEHVNNIAAEAFADCTGLKDVWCYAPAVIATEDEYTFDGLPKDESGYYKATLHVSLELLDEYKRTAPWKYFFKIQAYPSMLGDANGDGRISLADLTATINYKKTGIEREFFFANADIDGNEQIDEEDIRLIVDMILQSVEE